MSNFWKILNPTKKIFKLDPPENEESDPKEQDLENRNTEPKDIPDAKDTQ